MCSTMTVTYLERSIQAHQVALTHGSRLGYGENVFVGIDWSHIFERR
mgnify:FL=1